MKITETPLPGLLILEPKRFEDARGFFSEVWNARTLAQNGIEVDFVQDNHSLSRDVGCVRGLHYQSPPKAQDKLVRCGAGAVYDVAVDIRQGSPTFGKWFGVELSAANGLQLFIPKGFLHGFVTRTPNAELLYKCSNAYSPQNDGAVRFDDPALGIDWGIAASDAVLSDKDRAAPLLAQIDNPFAFEA